MELNNGTDRKQLVPRPYQTELLEKAIEKDIIVHLKTGSGKTFISVMLLNVLSAQVEAPFSKGGKRSLFLANTVPLVKQQAEFLREQLHLKIGDYYGDKVIDNRILDSWDEKIWQNEIEKFQVLVMTPQILVDMILHSFIKFEKINLIIFDECHHATGSHPYSQILDKLKQTRQESNDVNVRVLGLTASIVNIKCNLTKFNKMMKKLEEKFNCKIETASIIANEEDQNRKHEKPEIKVIVYDNDHHKSLYIYEILKNLIADAIKYDSEIEEMKRTRKAKALESSESNLNSENNFIFSSENENPYKTLKRELSDLESILEDLGLWSFSIALQETISKLKSSDLVSYEVTIKNEIKFFVEKMESLLNDEVRKLISKEDEENLEKILSYSSEKLNCLLDIYLEKSEKSNFHSIVFVERKAASYYIDFVLQKLSKLEKWAFIKSDHIFGVSGLRNKMTIAKQDKTLKKFRAHQINVLVATNILEEGVDVPACNMIVRFNKIYNFGSFVQSKGRARFNKSIYYVLRSNDESFDDLENFLAIEKDLEENLINKNSDDEEDVYFNQDEFNYLNSIIKPYVKGDCELTCLNAISLVNRYCSSLEHNMCGVLYPIYHIDSILIDGKKVFCCSVRLPPNSVLNKTIKGEILTRKKWAKMDAALKMCIELDKAGELAENLTILSKEDWLNPHFDLKENLEEDRKLGKKVGSTKLKREYETTFADELTDNQPKPNEDCFLYAFTIKEEVFDSKYPYVKQISDDTIFGFVSSKELPTIPRFKLYFGNSQFTITIVNTQQKFKLTLEQFEILTEFYKSYINNFLKIKANLNFTETIHGGLIVVFKSDTFEIDWQYFKKLIKNQPTAYELFCQDKENFLEKCQNTLWIHRSTLYSIIDVNLGQNPLDKFPRKDIEASNFKEYFKLKYNLDTIYDSQPLVEVNYISKNTNFINRGQNLASMKKIKRPNYKILLIPEHLKNVSIPPKHIFKYSMLPSVFYRLNCILKARKLQLIIENEIKRSLGLERVKNEKLIWDQSIKFHRVKQDLEKDEEDEINGKVINESISDEDELNEDLKKILNPIKLDKQMVIYRKNSFENLNNFELGQKAPLLMIKESVDNLIFPNIFNILQCLTLKSACDNFDLERYEVLGDCFLKLIVVLKIYTDFSGTNEGKMASLKSARVSNNYLYKLAIQKNLNQFIVWQNFMADLSWIPPNIDKKFFSENSMFKTKLADKSLADCVEALIGVYLIYLGSNAAKAFIQWLDFKISDKLGKANFTDKFDLPDPALVPRDESFVEMLTLKYSDFENFLGYQFKDKYYLLQAFTHPSDITNIYTSSYQKLELVGDAVLDVLVTQHIFQDKKEHSPGELTELRQALVNNRFFAHLAVKHGFHKYMSNGSQDIYVKLIQYTKEHELYPPDSAYLGIKKEGDLDVDNYEIEAPKFLADIFESVAGAIYLDSNCDLQTVWNVYFKMLEPYFISFKENIPCSPIKALYILKPQSKIQIDFKSTENVEDNDESIVEATLKIDDKSFIGTGRNKAIAKAVAYKSAVRAYDTSKNIIFF